MNKFFWSKCTEAFFASRKGEHVLAKTLCQDAVSLIHYDLPTGTGIEGRQSYLDKLQVYIERSVQNSKLVLPNMPLQVSSEEVHFAEIEKLQRENDELRTIIYSMPSIDPLCISDSSIFSSQLEKNYEKEDFGIIVFGYTRVDTLSLVLESLKRQDALKYTEVWLDGDQGNPNVRQKLAETATMVKKFPVKKLQTQRSNFGFRKMLILGLVEMCKKYRDILILEDDCFPVHDAVHEFRKGLDSIRDNHNIFSVYGHHFLVESEKETCARFQGWGWATTSNKLRPILRQLIDCYSMTEERYLQFVKLSFTEKIKEKIDVTPPRQPSFTFKNFFAWDETICLLTALNNQVHLPTAKRAIYNCGMGIDSTHFNDHKQFRKPPFNLITPDEVWQYF